MTEEDVERYARGFLMFLFGTTIFADRANTVPLCLLSAQVDVRDILHYDWGGAALATLYGYMSSASRGSGQLLGGYWRAWELWVYAYFPRLAPVPVAEPPPVVPFSSRFDGRCTRRPRETFGFFRRYFDTITPAEVCFTFSSFSFAFPLHISITVDNKLSVIFRSHGDHRLPCRRRYGVGSLVLRRPRVSGSCWRARSVGLGTWGSVFYARPAGYLSR
ncbi:protein MAIN-LIKE 2-like [Camellia sinensis]|uniref:protein MAIN-LIKE 2-like n=1 Tax=Camellia sinensis TaxID=4442 RepID=UPI0010356702|nr:protein MAIN-LIKE 2-like [Camellia sinensis]